MELFNILIALTFLSSVNTSPVHRGLSETLIQDTQNQTINLVFLANVDGKSFFADDTRRTWSEASAFCVSMQMKLASITSSAQFAALNAAANPDVFYRSYWTSGRESQLISEFKWDGTNSLASSSHVTNYFNAWNAVPLTCLVFEPYVDPIASRAFPHPCSGSLGALCET